MAGVSGSIRFTDTGDRANATFSVYNYKSLPDGTYDWIEVGVTGTEVGSVQLPNGLADLCFAHVGCNLDRVPADTYSVPKAKLPPWVFIVISIIATLLLLLAGTYWHKSLKHSATVKSMTALQQRMVELQDINDKLVDLDNTVEDVARKKDELILRRGSLLEKPSTWTDNATGTPPSSTRSSCGTILVEVLPHDEQYWTVLAQLQGTMKHAFIARLWRVQNVPLWSYYSFHKHRLERCQIDVRECSAWHGTSAIKPSVIYNDKQDGFMMQYSEKGFWGRGIYFAENSRYAHEYAHKPSEYVMSSSSIQTDDTDAASAHEDECDIFLVRLSVGEAIEMDRDKNAAMKMECATLTAPPINPKTKMRYNTVTGHTGDSRVWVLYENGRAYPEYLVRYYVGKRDEKRTPYRSRQQATSKSSELVASLTNSLNNSLSNLTKQWKRACDGETGISDSSSIHSVATPTQASHVKPRHATPLKDSMKSSLPDVLVSSNVVPPSGCVPADTNINSCNQPVIWEYHDTDSNTWDEYNPFHQTTLEIAYREFLLNPTLEKYESVEIDEGDWRRQIFFGSMTQIDPQRPSRTDTSTEAPPRTLVRRCPEHRRNAG